MPDTTHDHLDGLTDQVTHGLELTYARGVDDAGATGTGLLTDHQALDLTRQLLTALDTTAATIKVNGTTRPTLAALNTAISAVGTIPAPYTDRVEKAALRLIHCTTACPKA